MWLKLYWSWLWNLDITDLPMSHFVHHRLRGQNAYLWCWFLFPHAIIGQLSKEQRFYFISKNLLKYACSRKMMFMSCAMWLFIKKINGLHRQFSEDERARLSQAWKLPFTFVTGCDALRWNGVKRCKVLFRFRDRLPNYATYFERGKIPW